MRPLPPEVTGPDNDLADLLDHYIHRAQGDPQVTTYVFGERWGPERATPDKVFGFRPGNGVHDVHMNQGNSPQFRRADHSPPPAARHRARTHRGRPGQPGRPRTGGRDHHADQRLAPSIDLTGWKIADRAKRACSVPAGKLAPGATLVMNPTNGVALGNNGGVITLLDPQGLKVHGVSYTAEQSRDEGWTVVF